MAVVGVIRCLSGQEAYWTDMSTHAGQNLDRRENGLFPVLRGKLDVQEAIIGRCHVREHLDIGSATASRIGHQIEAAEQSLSVCPHGKDSAPFFASSCRFRTVGSFCKVQARFVVALFWGDLVAKLSLAAGVVEIGILSAPDMLHRALLSRAAFKPRVGNPHFACMVDKAAPRTGQNSNLVSHGQANRRFHGLLD